jgi:hypothetical protein
MAIRLSAGAIERVAQAPRQAEADLKRHLSTISYSERVEPYVPPFVVFAVALYDAEAGELVMLCNTYTEFESHVDEAMLRIIEDVPPDRGLATARAALSDELKRVRVERDVATGILYEVQKKAFLLEWDEKAQLVSVWEEVRGRTPARAEACTLYSQYGYWERFAPEQVRFALRSPNNSATVRQAVFWAIHQRKGFWLDQYNSRINAAFSQAHDGYADSERGRAELLSTGAQTKPRKRGPKPDFETAARVAEVVTRVTLDADWHPKLADICEALDEEKVPVPRGWRSKRQYRSWADCLERALAIKAIEYRLDIAKRREARGPETLS